MRAVVVYESQFGNTHLIAAAVGAGLGSAYDVQVVPVAQADSATISGADLVVVGGPTHVHGMTRESSRHAAAEMAAEADSLVTLEPGDARKGVREWLESLGETKEHCKAAAFDTRMKGPAAFTGRASKGVGRALRHHGYTLIAEPESFLVSKENELVPEEDERARAWGARLAAMTALAGSAKDG
jgi:Flavodoxin